MKIALISNIPVFPTTSGNRSRIRRLAEAFKEMGHEVVFIYLPLRWQAIDRAAHQAAFGRDYYIELRNDGTFGEFAQYLRGKLPFILRNVFQLMGLRTFYYTRLDKSYNPRWTPQITAAVGDADIALVEYVFNTKAFEAFPATTRRMLDTHDSFADRHKLYLERGLRTGYWISLRPGDENEGFRRADTVIAIQGEEATMFRRQLSERDTSQNPEVRVVSHLVQMDSPIADYSVDNAAIFVASDNPANRQAIESFMSHILPRIMERSVRFNLKIAGSVCRHVPNTCNVTKLGTVADLQAAYATAPVSLNPMLAGTGIAIKLLDAMAAGIPVVSTETGVRGLPAAYRNGVVHIGDNDYEAFAEAVVRLTTSTRTRRELGLKAFADAGRWHVRQTEELARCLSDDSHTQVSLS